MALLLLCSWLAPSAASAKLTAEPRFRLDRIEIDSHSSPPLDHRQIQRVADLFSGDTVDWEMLKKKAITLRSFYGLRNVRMRLLPDPFGRTVLQIALQPRTVVDSVSVAFYDSHRRSQLQEQVGEYNGRLWSRDLEKKIRGDIADALGEFSAGQHSIEITAVSSGGADRMAVFVHVSGMVQDGVMVADECPARIASRIRGHRFSQSRIDAIIERYVESLRENGFWAAELTATVHPAGELVEVRCVGTHLDVSYSVEVSGNRYFDNREVQLMITPAKEEVFRELDLVRLRSEIIEMYQSEGFFHAAVALDLTGTKNAKRIRVVVREGRLRVLKQLRLNGISEDAKEELLTLLPVTVSKFLQLTSDQSRIITNGRLAETVQVAHSFLLDSGFLEAPEPVTALTLVGATGFALDISMETGPEYRFGPTEGEQLLPGIAPEPPAAGTPFSYTRFSEWKQQIVERLREAGYLKSTLTVDTEVVVANREVRPRITGHAGEPFFVGQIYVLGVDRDEGASFMRVLPLAIGDVAADNTLTQIRRRLYLLGLFKSVEVEWFNFNIGDNMVDILIRLQRKPAGEVSISAGVNTAEGLDATLIVAHHNLFGSLRSVEAQGKILFGYEDVFLSRDLSRPQRVGAQIGFYERWLFGTPLRGRATIRFEKDTTQSDFDFQLWEGIIGVDYGEPAEQLHLFYYSLQNLAKFNILNRQLNPDTVERIGKLVYSFSRSGLDDRFDPRSGTYVQGDFGYADRWVGSEYRFIRLSGTGTWLYPVRKRLTAVASIDSGVFIPLERARTYYPRTEKFRLGGVGSVRGYLTDAIGPLTNEGLPEGEYVNIGGLRSVSYQFEARIPFAGNFDFALFQDSGVVWRTESDRAVLESGASFGAGVLYHSPIGPIRFDYGQKLFNNLLDDTRFAMHFYIGALF